MDNLFKEKILFKINDIDRLFDEYQLVFEKAKCVTPDLFDMTILGSVLHSFYNGLENIFELVAKNIDNNIPTGNKSHKELLQQMVNVTDARNNVISEELYVKLREYATFRHFFRHAYSFQLDWAKLEPLVENLFDVWQEAKECLKLFIDSIA